MLTANQIRAARALVRWSAHKLAEQAGVHLATVQRMERCEGHVRGNIGSLLKIRDALEGAGVEFLGDGESSGVRMRAATGQQTLSLAPSNVTRME